MMKFTVFLLSAFLPIFTMAQNGQDSSSASVRKFELSMNVTSTLSNALGNSGNSGQLLDPYLIGLKYQLNKSTWFRSGFNVKTKQITENSGQREIIESDYRIRLGFEKRVLTSSKFILYSGLDLVGGYFNSDVTTNDFGTFLTEIKLNQVSFGGGPVLGLMYQINKRMAISTEASLYYQYISTYRYLNVGFPDPTPIENTTYGYLLLPVIPSSLYFILKF